jgi:hypothetical protein
MFDHLQICTSIIIHQKFTAIRRSVMSPTLKKIVGATSALALTLGLFTPAAYAQEAKASVRVVHASPDAPAVDIYVNDAKTLSNIAFKRVTNYLALDAGQYNIKVYPTNSDTQETDPVLQADVSLNSGWDYTVAAVGKLDNIQAKVFNDNLNMPEEGKSKVRAYHLSPNAPAVNVAVQEGSTLVRGLSFPNATDYITVDAGTYNLAINTTSDNTTVLDLANTALAANQVQSVFVFGLVGESPELSYSITTDRKATGTPATGASDSFVFMAFASIMMLGAGIVLKKIATAEESLR